MALRTSPTHAVPEDRDGNERKHLAGLVPGGKVGDQGPDAIWRACHLSDDRLIVAITADWRIP